MINRSYMDEAGAVVEMQSRITDEDLAFMASVRVGKQTLAMIYRDWLAAGVVLGRQARQRARLQQAIRKQGTAAADIDTRGARLQWIWSAGTLVTPEARLRATSEDFTNPRAAIPGRCGHSPRGCGRHHVPRPHPRGAALARPAQAHDLAGLRHPPARGPGRAGHPGGRGPEPSARALVRAAHRAQLDRWLERVLSAASLRDVLGRKR